MEMGYREIIKRKLADRCAKNRQYSLRALARDMNWDVSQLSRVLNAKQHLSFSSAKLLAEELFDASSEKEIFLALVEFETAKKPEVRRLAANKIETLRVQDTVIPLQIEAFRVISEWYHVAILDYTLLNHADTSPSAIAKVFGLTELETRFAIERLLGLGLLERKGQRLGKTATRLSVPSGPRQQSIRTFHKQMITKALDAIEAQTTTQRYLRAETLVLDAKDLTRVIELIDDLGKRAQRVSSKSKKKELLYQINVQLFDLMPSKKKGKKS